MIEVLQLDKNDQRPVVYTEQFHGCTALLDTGALFPVWTASEAALRELGGKLIKDDISFTGFGGSVNAKLYELTVTLGKIIYPNMHLIYSEDENIPGYFLLSATMFQGMAYTIDAKNHILRIDTCSNQAAYNLKIKDENGKLYVFLNYA